MAFTKALFEEFSGAQLFWEKSYQSMRMTAESNVNNPNKRKVKEEPGASPGSKRPKSQMLHLFEINSPNLSLFGALHPGSWYRKENPTIPPCLTDRVFHERQTSRIGWPTHDRFLHLFALHGLRSPLESGISTQERAEREELQRIQRLVVEEQQSCLRLYERKANTTGKDIYFNFAQSIPNLLTQMLRKRLLKAIEELPHVFIKDVDFDFSQMVFRTTETMLFQPAVILRLDRFEKPEMQPLSEESFKSRPIALGGAQNQKSAFRQLINRNHIWPRTKRASHEELHCTVNSAQMGGHVAINRQTLCLVDLDVDVLVFLASCSVVSEFEITIPFEKYVDSKLGKTLIRFGSELLPINGYPPQLHCSEILKYLFQEQFGHKNQLSSDPEDPTRDSPLITFHTLVGTDENIGFMVRNLNQVFDDTSTVGESTQNIFKRLVFYVFKREMQNSLGLEELSVEEVMKVLMILTLFPQSKVVLVRVDQSCSCILHVTDYRTNSAALQTLVLKYNSNMQSVLHKLFQVISKISKLETDGHYVLRRSGFTSRCDLYIQSNLSRAPDLTQRHTLNFSSIYSSSLNLIPTQVVAWRPIDVSKILPFHEKVKRIPATFPPSMHPNNQTEQSKATKKIAKRRKQANANK